jgi:hypothetical protein
MNSTDKQDFVKKFTGTLNPFTVGDFDNECVDWNRPSQLTKIPIELKEWFAKYLKKSLEEQKKEVIEKMKDRCYLECSVFDDIIASLNVDKK